MRVLFILVALLFSSIAQAEIVVYNTYEDFLKNKGEVYERIGGSMHVMGKISLFMFDKNDKKSTINCGRIWGFKYEGHLFRTDPNGQYAKLIQQGRICYYENGPAHVEMIRNKSDKAYFTLGYECYFSNDLKSEIVVCPIGLTITGKSFKRFQKENPQHEELYKCIKNKVRAVDSIRQCVAAYNKE